MDTEISQEHGLHHQLSAGQMTMVAVGGSIGTGLLLGSAAAIEMAGPAVILTFLLAAFINWTVTMALGELASTHPAAGSFGVYGDLYLNGWSGFISRAGYWAAIAISIGAELVASATYMAYWFPTVPALVWVVLFSALLLLVNLWDVGRYGRFEFWFAMIKAVAIAAFVVLGAALLLAGRVPAQYTTQCGFFPRGTLAPLLAITFAIYTFGGIEFVAVTSGESRSAHEIAKAVKMTFVTLALIYLSAITVLVGIMPWNRTGVTESPFVGVPPGQDSGCRPPDELRCAHGCLVGRERGPIRLLEDAFFPGTKRLGPCSPRAAEQSWIAQLGSVHVLLRDSCSAGVGKMGAWRGLRIHPAGRLFRDDSLLASLAGSPRFLSASTQPQAVD